MLILKLIQVVCEEEFPSSVEQFCGIINVGFYVQCYRYDVIEVFFLPLRKFLSLLVNIVLHT